jgi:hypothetical protein
MKRHHQDSSRRLCGSGGGSGFNMQIKPPLRGAQAGGRPGGYGTWGQHYGKAPPRRHADARDADASCI